MIHATFDSNILISAFEFHGTGLRLLQFARAGKIRLDISRPILDETFGVLRDKFSWDPYRLHFGRLDLLTFANYVEPVERIQSACADPDDDRILECAIEAKSEFIVARDEDLLRLKEFRGVQIVTPEELCARL